MQPVFDVGHVRADCPDCGTPTTFEYRSGPNEFGTTSIAKAFKQNGVQYNATTYKLLRCAVCHRGGIAKVAVVQLYETSESTLIWFWPTSVRPTKLPSATPEGVSKEYREAEMCMSVEAWRGAAALFRSALEKTLKHNGYKERDLYKKIEAAGSDGVITSAREQRAQELVRTLGNDVLHDEWRAVSQEEAEAAQHYVGRVIEDLYDDRESVEVVLREKSRLPTGSAAEAPSSVSS